MRNQEMSSQNSTEGSNIKCENIYNMYKKEKRRIFCE